MDTQLRPYVRLIAFGMSDLFSFPLNRVWALTEKSNEPSVRLLGRLGFRHEGTLREVGYQGGRFRDYESFSLLRRDFEGETSSRSK